MLRSCVFTAFACVSLLCLPSCGPALSVFPLNSAEEALPDERLTGVWQRHGNGDDPPFLYFASLKKEGKPAVGALMFGGDGDEFAPLGVQVWPAKIGERNYLTAKWLGKLQALAEPTLPSEHYFVPRYEFTPEGLFAFAIVDADEIAKAIDAGKLKGVGMNQGPPGPDALLTDTTENLAKYFAETDRALDTTKWPKYRRIDQAK